MKLGLENYCITIFFIPNDFFLPMEWIEHSGWMLDESNKTLEIKYSPPAILPIFASLCVSLLIVIPGILTAIGNIEPVIFLFCLFGAIAVYVSSKFFSNWSTIDHLDLQQMKLSTYQQRQNGDKRLINSRDLREIGTPKLVIVEGGDGTFGPNFDHDNPGIYTVNLTCEARYPGLDLITPQSKYHTSKCGASIVMRNYDIVMCGGIQTIQDSKSLLQDISNYLEEVNPNWKELNSIDASKK